MKKSKSPVKTKGRSLLLFVENCSPRAKFYENAEEAKAFIKDFKKNSPDKWEGYWVDYLITDIQGEVLCFDDAQID